MLAKLSSHELPRNDAPTAYHCWMMPLAWYLRSATRTVAGTYCRGQGDADRSFFVLHFLTSSEMSCKDDPES